jgi:adenylate cyclase
LRRRGLRYVIVHWYTYRTVVGVLLGSVLALLMFGLYMQEQACGSTQSNCFVSLAVHPEDRLFPRNDQPSPEVVIVGIDDKSINKVGAYPFTREKYATVLDTLVADGAAVVVFDVGFTEERAGSGDDMLQKALANARVPVVLAYGQCDACAEYGDHELKLKGIDQVPIRKFRCLDQNDDPFAPCTQPIKNVELGSTTVVTGSDAIVNKMPMFVEPACHVQGRCDIAMLNPISFVAYRDLMAPGAGVELRYVPGAGATFGQAWTKPLYVDGHGMATVNWSGGPGNLEAHHQYQSFVDVYNGKVSRGAIEGKIVLVGAYQATGIQDSEPVPTGDGAPMAGVEIHANLLTELLSPQQTKFTYPEPSWAVLLTLLALCVGMGALLANLSLLNGAGLTVVALVGYTVPWAVLQNIPVPDLVHPWLGIALTYTGLTAYRFLYEDRERRKVTAIFGQYLKPEIVDQLAAQRSLEDIAVGGERRELSLLFVDIRGFTSMSESMAAEDVVKVLDAYLEDLTEVIFKWDGVLDKYVGDEIMAAWNAVDHQPQHALCAVRCAYEMLVRGPDLNQKLTAKGLPEIRFGIGVNTGLAVWGNMGSRFRRQFTAIGDTINTAARFCSAAGPFELLIGEPTYEFVKDYLAVEVAPGIQLKGKSAETFKIFRAVAIRQDPDSPWLPFPRAQLAPKN